MPLIAKVDSLLKPAALPGVPASSAATTFSNAARSSPLHVVFSSRRSAWAKSASMSSMLMASASDRGSTLPSTCIVSSSSKVRITWQIASHSRTVARNWLPSPSPRLAPRTSPATSTHSITGGAIRAWPEIDCSPSSHSSGTAIGAMLGSIVQKGKFAACARALCARALNSVLLPTFGSPTMPTFIRMVGDEHRCHLFPIPPPRLSRLLLTPPTRPPSCRSTKAEAGPPAAAK
mmetsp:Transcript_108466/g.315446  ORF Transcript_108466/g.315446 Transcript_108466/m.315446 type:complete len:233 (+) Transcript_108466:646-1344(+)